MHRCSEVHVLSLLVGDGRYLTISPRGPHSIDQRHVATCLLSPPHVREQYGGDKGKNNLDVVAKNG